VIPPTGPEAGGVCLSSCSPCTAVRRNCTALAARCHPQLDTGKHTANAGATISRWCLLGAQNSGQRTPCAPLPTRHERAQSARARARARARTWTRTHIHGHTFTHTHSRTGRARRQVCPDDGVEVSLFSPGMSRRASVKRRFDLFF